MRKGFWATLLLAGLLTAFAEPPVRAAVSVTVSISYFHDTLAPYGRWTRTSRYGEVWIPSGIAVGWEPYWDGEWIWTDYGWTWVSFDPWGDIPCHYGTWAWVDPDGWVWVPGTVWAPAWVTWAWTDDYIGWAPVPPTLDITVSGYAGPPVVVAASSYVFVPSTQFVGVNVRTARIAETQNTVLLPRSQKATRFSVSGGIVRTTADPPLSFVQRVSQKRIQRVSVDRIKARPTTLAAAHVSGNRFRVVAPTRERDAAIMQAKKRPGKAPSAPVAATSATTKSNKTLREARASKSRSATTRGVTGKPPGKDRQKQEHVAQGNHGKRSRQPAARRQAQGASESHPVAHQRQGGHSASPPVSERPAAHAAHGSKSSSSPAVAAKPHSPKSEHLAPSAREEKRMVMNSRPARPAPASAAPPREPSHKAARPAPPSQAHGNPPPAPPAAARAEKPQPPAPANPPKENKEKEKGRE